jgi:starvation-inducible DNA-binding protein
MTNHNATKTAKQQSAPAKESGKIKSYPAPKQLATPTDLKPEEVGRIVEAVNPLIADAFALFTKTKNFHWHVASSHYRDYHLMLDEQADSIFESIDIMAERMRRIGATTIRSISHIGQLQTIEDDNRDFVPPDEMIRELLDDNLHIASLQRAAIEICDKNRDTPTGNLLQEILDQTERRIWFLYEVSTGGKNEY